MVHRPARDDRDFAFFLHRFLFGIAVEYRALTPCTSGRYSSCPESFHDGLRLRTSNIRSAL